MKKALLLCISLLLAFALSACGPQEATTTQTPGAATTGAATTAAPAAVDPYELLSALLQKSYSSISLAATVQSSSATLPSSYTLTADGSLTFSVAEISRLPSDDSFTSLPESFVTQIPGSATVSNGQFTQVTAEKEVILPPVSVVCADFALDRANLEEISATDGSFSAKVKQAAQLLPGLSGATNMQLSISYTADAVTAATVTYQTATLSVSLVYAFTL